MIEILGALWVVAIVVVIWACFVGFGHHRPKCYELPPMRSIAIDRYPPMWTDSTIRHTARGPGVYTAGNSVGAEVWDVDRVEKLQKIVEIDTSENTLTFAAWPLRVKGDEIETYKVRYRKIHAISDGGDWAVLFHCYGRITNG